MMTIHPAHALLLASTRHHELVVRADEFRLARRTEAARAQPDCQVPPGAAPVAAPCRPDPRRAAARPSARHRSPRRRPRDLVELVLHPHR